MPCLYSANGFIPVMLSLSKHDRTPGAYTFSLLPLIRGRVIHRTGEQIVRPQRGPNTGRGARTEELFF